MMMNAVCSPPTNGTTLAEAILTIRRQVIIWERLAERHCRAGQVGLARNLVEKVHAYDAICMIAITKAAMDGTLAHHGFHELADGRWAEILTCGRYRLYRPFPPPAAETTRASVEYDFDAFPDDLRAMPLKTASKIVVEHFGHVKAEDVFSWPDDLAGHEWVSNLYLPESDAMEDE